MSEAVDFATSLGVISQVEKLTSNHQVKTFKSTNNSLNVFLRRHAFKNQEADSSQTYVVHRNSCVAGYYTLTAGSVDQISCSPSVASGMPADYPIPVIVLARLAVDRTEQRRGLGRALLKDAFGRIASAAEIVGVRAVLVHAIDETARSFYQKFGFEEFPAGNLQLMLLLKDIRAAMSEEK
jgi:GNAT superfamily N-acetyltransferase